ncbi:MULTISPECIES: hypothetical protein [Flavobacterium]|uniref:hypothetical protein n=1 Tax=Flavobacterium TaxID=237 RepID=UPI00118347B4|nr:MULTISPECIES: hypothetical protein [Flavobacterium]MCR4030701.1 hypothetical protein [Flavobacterium panacis]
MRKNNHLTVINASKMRKKYSSFLSSNVTASVLKQQIGPIISLDHFYINSPLYPSIKHMDCNSITYIFQDSAGEIIYGSSQQALQTLKPGGILLNVGGNGLIENGITLKNESLLHGLQIFLKLTTKETLSGKTSFFYEPNSLPVFRDQDSIVRVLVGRFRNIKSKISASKDLTILDVQLNFGTRFVIDAPEKNNVLVYIVKDGDASSIDNSAESPIEISRQSGHLSILSPYADIHFILISGKRIKDNVFQRIKTAYFS